MRREPMTTPAEKPLQLTPAEVNLIVYLRALKFGEVTIQVHQGQPVQADRIRERVRFVS
jgi:hypothetical protein